MSTRLNRLALGVLVPGFAGAGAPDWLRRRLGEGLGAVCLFARNLPDGPAGAAKLTAALRAERPDVLVAIDEEGGDVTRLHARDGSPHPGNAALGAIDDTELTAAVAAALGAELAAAGINWNLAPVLDVNSNPCNPVIGVRSFGADPQLVARHGAAFVTGLQQHGVAATAKHFPGHGDTAVDSHLGLPVVAGDITAALAPFRAAIAAGVRAVMSAHLLAPAYDRDAPATLSRRILTELLREELGFGGVIVTDGLEMAAISATVGFEAGAVRAIAAGADAICVGGGFADAGTVDRLQAALTAAVAEGRLAEDRLAAAAGRVDELAQLQVAGDPSRVAARRALRVEGEVSVPAPPCVVELSPPANIAAGTTSWGIAGPLADRLPGTTVVRLADARAMLPVDNVPLVIVVRDAHRFAWQQQAVEQLLSAHPGAVVVEMGLPMWRPVGARGYIATYGAARVNAEAAAELIAGGQ